MRQLKDNDEVAAVTLSKIASSKFIGTIYILREVLSVLSSLTKNFKRGHVNVSHIQPSVNYTTYKLTEITESKSTVVAVKRRSTWTPFSL